jgi:hypothetical protein
MRLDNMPFVDQAGQQVSTQADWLRSRNQQRNYETLLQLFGLRTQPQNITNPVLVANKWEFTFESENQSVFAMDGDPLGWLKQDAETVPMVQDVNSMVSASALCTSGPNQNIWFELVNS